MTATMRFGSLTIAYDERVLRPRPWTLAQAAWAAELAGAAPAGNLLELCCGAGQIGLSMARMCADQRRPRNLIMVDADNHACRFARANLRRAGLDVQGEVRTAMIEQALVAGEMFAVIVADPPWVRSVDTVHYPKDPLTAIDGGSDGLEIARSCVAAIGDHLLPGGSAVLQLRSQQQIDELSSELDDRLTLVSSRVVPGENGALARLMLI